MKCPIKLWRISLFAILIPMLLLLTSCADKEDPTSRPKTLRQIMIGRGVKNREEQIRLPDGSPVKIYTVDITDLALLSDLPIEGLILGNRTVSNLSAITEMDLKVLVARDSQVTDISPLTNMPLVILDILGAPVQDLSSISNLPLVHFAFSEKKVTNGMDVLRSMESLELINGYTPSNFWARLDYWNEP